MVGVETVLIETLRDAARQSFYIASGVSWTMRSKHLPQPPNGLALAFDLCPRDYLAEKNWAPGGDEWFVLGDLAEEADLEWGGTWTSQKDYPHFQKGVCTCPRLAPGTTQA